MVYPQLELQKVKGSKATIHTNMGDLSVQLFDDWAPQAVKNFVALAQKGYYEGVLFHRVIADFMIQGGDPTGTGAGGESIYGKAFDDEFSDDLYHLRGAMSMANAGPNTNGSQFFIVQNKSTSYSMETLIADGWPGEIAESYVKGGGTPYLDHRHSVFGQLVGVESYETLDKIAGVETMIGDRPVKDVSITGIDVVVYKKPEVKKPLPSESQTFDNREHLLKIGDIFDAKVIGLQRYGAFVQFDGDKRGLVHISELKSGFVKDIHEVVKVGDSLRVQVIDSDEYSGRISLSTRTLEAHPKAHKLPYKHFATNYHQSIGFKSLEEQLPKWVRENEDYLESHQS